MAHRMSRERGAVAIQIALFLPILIVIVVGAFEVWRVLHMQQVLNDAAYQGVRLLSMQPDHEDIPIQVEHLVRRYVSRAPYVDPALRADPGNQDLLYVGIAYFPPRCGEAVSVRLQLAWTVGQGWARRPSGESWLPFLGRRAVLRARAEGVVLCERDEDAQ
jgi:hypothetical protein